MAIEFKLPDLGENVATGDVLDVLVAEGDTISAEQSVIEVETGKAVMEVACPHAGKITKVLVKKGDKVPVGAPILMIETAGAAAKPAPVAPPKTAPAAEAPKTAPRTPVAAEPPRAEPPRPTAPPPAPTAAPAMPPRITASMLPDDEMGEDTPSPAAPATRRLARELGVDLAHVQGTGPGGRIVREDVMAAVREGKTAPAHGNGPTKSASSAPAAATADGVETRDNFGAVRRVPLSKIRQVIAANMVRSHTTIPHVTNFDDADITELERLRKGSMSDFVGKNVKLTTMAFLLKAVAHSLKLHPAINASLDMEKNETIYKQYVSLGVAVDTPRGLVVPVIRDCDRLTIPQIAQTLTEIAERARNNQIGLAEMQGGTFTISNLGAIGGTYSTPIINYPEVAIMLVGRSRQLPVVVEDKIVPRLMCPLSLSYDHRWIDGAVAARFLNDVKGFLEAPARLLLAP